MPTNFEYGGDGKRLRRVQGDKELIYVGDLYERETVGNVVVERFYVSNDERAIAVVERLQSGDAWRFIQTDHLGSVDVISGDGGVEIDRRSNDAWGAPRDPQWGGNGAPSPNKFTRRSFTWHEWDDDVGLVNAKGRMYDPVVARFLQTDPIIADLLDAQTLNPYSYVFNRPLVFTDPSGFDAESELPYAYAHPGSMGGYIGNVYHAPEVQIFVWALRAARDTPAPQVRYSEVTNSPISGIAPPALAAVDPSAPDVPQLPPRWVEFGGGIAVAHVGLGVIEGGEATTRSKETREAMSSLSYIGVMLETTEYPGDIGSDFLFGQRYIGNYLGRPLKAAHFKTEGYYKLIIEGMHAPPNRCSIVPVKSLCAPIYFDQARYGNLGPDEHHEFFLGMYIEGIEKANRDFPIPYDVLMKGIEDFRRGGYKNEWVHKRQLLRPLGLHATLLCDMDTHRIRLRLQLERKGDVIFDKSIFETKPDEIMYAHMFKDVIVKDDKIVVRTKMHLEENQTLFTLDVNSLQ